MGGIRDLLRSLNKINQLGKLKRNTNSKQSLQKMRQNIRNKQPQQPLSNKVIRKSGHGVPVSIISVETITPLEKPKSPEKVRFPDIINVDYESDDYNDDIDGWEDPANIVEVSIR